MNSYHIHTLIELIYEAVIEPAKWSDLLNSLAEFVDYVENQTAASDDHPQMMTAIPAIAAIGDSSPRTTISEVLKSITDLDSLDGDKDPAPAPAGFNYANELLVSHFSRAIKIAKQLVDREEQHEVVLSLLDRLPIALVLVDERATVIESNALADEILGSGSGLFVLSGKLNAGNENNARLLELIRNMSRHDPVTTRGKTLTLVSESEKNNLMLFLAPHKHYEKQHSSVAVFIAQRKSQPIALPVEMKELYGLTEKELHVTGQLIRGFSIKEISEQSGVTQNTVRSQVKSIFKKTQTSRQAELVSLVYNGMGVFVSTVPAARIKNDMLLTKNRPWQNNHQTIELADGRNLTYQEYGATDSDHVVVHCHGVLGSRLELALDARQICEQKNIRLIVVDRPGYGLSDPDPVASFKKWPWDLQQLLDRLGVDQVYLTGYAMGGQYALACAHEIPERIKRIAIISAGMRAETKDDFEQMIPFYKMNTHLARHVPKVYKLLSGVLVKGMLSDLEGFFSQLAEKLDAADQEIMTRDDFKEEVFTSLQEAFKQGGKASSRDVIQYMHDWGFDLNNIKTPVDIWHGDCDHHVPVILAKKLDKELPNKNYFIQSGQGHYMFYAYWENVLMQLMDQN